MWSSSPMQLPNSPEARVVTHGFGRTRGMAPCLSVKSESGGLDGPFWALEQRVKAASGDSTGTLAVAGEFLATLQSDLRSLDPSVVLDDLHVASNYHSVGSL